MGLVSTLVAGKSLHRLQSCDRRQAMGSRVQASGGEAAVAGGGGGGRGYGEEHASGWLVHAVCEQCNSGSAQGGEGLAGWVSVIAQDRAMVH